MYLLPSDRSCLQSHFLATGLHATILFQNHLQLLVSASHCPSNKFTPNAYFEPLQRTLNFLSPRRGVVKINTRSCKHRARCKAKSCTRNTHSHRAYFHTITFQQFRFPCSVKLINFMKLRPSQEAANCAAIQELPSNSWNPKVHYLIRVFTRALHWSLS
jgi:hypothetical protein